MKGTVLVSDEELAHYNQVSLEWPRLTLNARQICDLELILNGGFAPLTGFLSRADYESVCNEMRLADGSIWPIPIVLDVGDEFAARVTEGDSIALRDPEGVLLAVLTLEEKWIPDLRHEAQAVYGTVDEKHPAVDYLFRKSGSTYLSGQLKGVQLPVHFDFPDVRLNPQQTRSLFRERGWDQVVAFQTRNPMHRAHYELTRRAAAAVSGGLLIHPVVGLTKPGDVSYVTRVKCYRKLLRHYDDQAVLSLLPLAMRMGGPREAVWHAIIRKNYGCTHLIVGRDHAGPGVDSQGNPFYGPFDAQELLREHEDALQIKMVPFKAVSYVPEVESYLEDHEIKEGMKPVSLSGTEFRRRLEHGDEIPEWFSFPDVITELQKSIRSRSQQGFTVFFSGLPCSGKSTLARALIARLQELTRRRITLMDGDIVRLNLSSELGFSKEHRDINIRRIGFVASEITKHGGVCVCAPIAPYNKTRRDIREAIEEHGGFVLVHVSTPVEICESRDRKGMYAKARQGILKEFTGVSDPYEEPTDAELKIDTSDKSPTEEVELVVSYLREVGYLADEE